MRWITEALLPFSSTDMFFCIAERTWDNTKLRPSLKLKGTPNNAKEKILDKKSLLKKVIVLFSIHSVGLLFCDSMFIDDQQQTGAQWP